jgi:hypothetical protein
MAAVLEKFDRLQQFLVEQESIPIEQATRIVNFTRSLDTPNQGGKRRRTHAKKGKGRSRSRRH